jgi:hypothetical protein
VVTGCGNNGGNNEDTLPRPYAHATAFCTVAWISFLCRAIGTAKRSNGFHKHCVYKQLGGLRYAKEGAIRGTPRALIDRGTDGDHAKQFQSSEFYVCFF